jgi:branched-chain amino acid transport system ATP-binding protein
MLDVTNIDTYYGKSHVLHGVSLDASEDEIVAVIGRNGVGKTTLMRSIIGLTPPKSGRITFDGVEITGKRPNDIANMGMGFIPQERRMFPDMTVLENLKMGFGTAAVDPERIERAYELFPKLRDRAGQRAGTLSGGEQQMVAMARALVKDPKLVLVDEPTEGLMPALIPDIMETIREIADAGYTILLVEQNIDFVLDVSDRIYVMDNGRIQTETTPAQLRDEDDVLQRYLGVTA